MSTERRILSFGSEVLSLSPSVPVEDRTTRAQWGLGWAALFLEWASAAPRGAGLGSQEEARTDAVRRNSSCERESSLVVGKKMWGTGHGEKGRTTPRHTTDD
jgi:hypothetical protein